MRTSFFLRNLLLIITSTRWLHSFKGQVIFHQLRKPIFWEASSRLWNSKASHRWLQRLTNTAAIRFWTCSTTTPTSWSLAWTCRRKVGTASWACKTNSCSSPRAETEEALQEEPQLSKVRTKAHRSNRDKVEFWATSFPPNLHGQPIPNFHSTPPLYFAPAALQGTSSLPNPQWSNHRY